LVDLPAILYSSTTKHRDYYLMLMSNNKFVYYPDGRHSINCIGIIRGNISITFEQCIVVSATRVGFDQCS